MHGVQIIHRPSENPTAVGAKVRLDIIEPARRGDDLSNATVGQVMIPVEDFGRDLSFYKDVLRLPFLFSAPLQMASSCAERSGSWSELRLRGSPLGVALPSIIESKTSKLPTLHSRHKACGFCLNCTWCTDPPQSIGWRSSPTRMAINWPSWTRSKSRASDCSSPRGQAVIDGRGD